MTDRHEPPVDGGEESPEDLEGLPMVEKLQRKISRMPVHENTVPLWLITFTDVMALTLTFFVLLFSMSNPNNDAWSDIVTALDSRFNVVFGASKQMGPVDKPDVNRPETHQALDLQYLSTLVEKLLENYPELGNTAVARYGDRIVISLPNDLLFQPGSAQISDGGRVALQTLGDMLKNIANRIEVYGHSDPRPVTGGFYNSNWDLSLARASNVAGLIYEAGYDKDIITKGIADGQFYLIPAELSVEERNSRARRVDIVIKSEDDLFVPQ